MDIQQKIEPQKVTKPIQLLAAWLVGLIVVDGSFLMAATSMQPASWERAILIVASVINVPLFLAAIFLLQTKFRPELQEDLFYSKYLDKKTNRIVTVSRDEKLEMELSSIRNKVISLSEVAVPAVASGGASPNKPVVQQRLGYQWKVAINDYLDNFEEIRKLLKDKSIPVSDIFGSEYTSGKPKHKVLTLSRQVDFESKVTILLLASKAKIESYTYFDPQDEGIKEDILIGSYGYESKSCVPINGELIKFFESSPEPIDLKHYEVTHAKKYS